MDPKIKCLKCGSYIHDADHCWNWQERRWCYTYIQLRDSCDCDHCKSTKICQYCNNWKFYCYCSNDRCPTCNEHLKNFGRERSCRWNHSKSLCQFCKLPSHKIINRCSNDHDAEDNLCEVCNLPKLATTRHQHDGTLCKKCGTLLNYGKCIYQCVNGGNRCVHCYWEGVVNNKCQGCKKEQSGQLTKAAIK